MWCRCELTGPSERVTRPRTWLSASTQQRARVARRSARSTDHWDLDGRPDARRPPLRYMSGGGLCRSFRGRHPAYPGPGGHGGLSGKLTLQAGSLSMSRTPGVIPALGSHASAPNCARTNW